MTDRIRIAAALGDGNLRAFLRVIRAGEGTADEDGYRRHFGGELFESFADHPRRAITKSLGGKPLTSTAAGAYQFLSRTWDECAAAMGLGDFSPASQDLAAVFLIDRRGALYDVLAGSIESAIAKCAKEWASLPGSPYGQPTKTLAQALRTYAEFGGVLRPADEPAPIETRELPKEPRMAFPAILAALLPSLIDAVPRLATIFKPGSEVAERNVAAAGVAFDIAKKALSASNEQEVIERIKSDPAALTTVKQAVEAQWFQLVEAGGGGIEGARKADAVASAGGGMLKSPSFYIAMALLPLVYMIVGSVVGLWGDAFSDEVRSAIANGIVGMIIGSLAGYYFGQTTSRNRT